MLQAKFGRLIVASSLLTASCNLFWQRQDGDDFNRSFIRLKSASFQGVQTQPPIPAQVVNGVTIDDRSDARFVATRARSFDVFSPSGSSLCHIDTTAELTAAPTLARDAAIVGGYYGRVWSFDPKQCAINPGFPLTVATASIVGPPIIFLDQIIVAAADGKIVSINNQSPPTVKWSVSVPSPPVGSLAATAAGWGSDLKNVLLVATRDSGVRVLDLDTGAELDAVNTGQLAAGVSIGMLGDQQIVIIPEYGPVVRAVNLQPGLGPRWTQTVSGASPSTARFESEASITDDSVYLTTGTHLVGLQLDGGTPKWTPIDLHNSGGALRIASDNQDNVYVANGGFLQVYRGSDGALLKSVPIVGSGLNVRPSIARDGTVVTGSDSSILQFH